MFEGTGRGEEEEEEEEEEVARMALRRGNRENGRCIMWKSPKSRR